MIRWWTEIITNSPTIAYNKLIEPTTFSIFLKIVDNFKDNKEDIRRSVGDWVSTFWWMINNRDIKTNEDYLNQIYSRTMTSVHWYTKDNPSPSSYPIIDGFILLIKSFGLRKEFILNKFSQIYFEWIPCGMSKNNQVKIAYMDIIPFLAECSGKNILNIQFFKDFLIPLLKTKQSEDIRHAVLICFGKLCKWIPQEIFVETTEKLWLYIVKLINKDIIDTAIFDCLSDMMDIKMECLKTIPLNSLLTKMFKIKLTRSHLNLIEHLWLYYADGKYEHIKIIMVTLHVISIICSGEMFSFRESMKFIDNNISYPIHTESDFYSGIIKTATAFMGNTSNNSNHVNKDELICLALGFLYKINHRFFLQDILSFYNNSCIPWLNQANTPTNAKVKEQWIELSSSNWLRLYKGDLNETRFYLCNIVDAYLNCLLLNDHSDDFKTLVLRNINAKDSFYFIFIEDEAMFRKWVSWTSINDNEIKKWVVTIIRNTMKSQKKCDNYFIIYIHQSLMSWLITLKESSSIIQIEDEILLWYYYVQNWKEFMNKDQIMWIFDYIWNLLQHHWTNPVWNVNILKIISECVQFEELTDKNIENFSDIVINICINNLKQGVNTSKLEVSWQAIYEIVRKKNINLYSTIPSINDDSEISAPYWEWVMILIQILRRDTSANVTKLIWRIFGWCGVMDPEKWDEMVKHMKSSKPSANANKKPQNTIVIPSMTLTDIDQCTEQAIMSWMRIWKDNTQQELSTQIIACWGSWIKSLQPSDSPWIDIILPTVIEMIPQFEQSYAKSMFENMLIILKNFKNKFQNYIEQFINIIKIYLGKESYHDIVFQVLPKVWSEFEIDNYYYIFVPSFINWIKNNSKETKNIIECFSWMAYKWGPFLNVVLPEIILLYDKSNDTAIITNILSFIDKLLLLDNIGYFLPMIIPSLLNKIVNNKRYGDQTIKLFSKMNSLLRGRFLSYLPSIVKTFNKIGIAGYRSTLQSFLKPQDPILSLSQQVCEFKCKNGLNTTTSPDMIVPNNSIFITNRNSIGTPSTPNQSNTQTQATKNMKTRKAQTDKELIVKVFDTQHCSVEEDWREWLKSTSKILFEQSPSYALFYCHMVADYYFPLIIELYNYGFISVWHNWNDYQKMDLIKNLKTSLTHNRTPNDILLTILNLAEFIEREDNNMNFLDPPQLGQIAWKCKAYAKALYYKESDLKDKNDFTTMEQLISLYYELKLPESAIGILKLASINNKPANEDIWNIKLHQWKQGLRAVNIKLEKAPKDSALLKMKWNCLDGLCDWEGIWKLNVIQDNETSLILAKASLNLSEWDKLHEFNTNIKVISEDNWYEKNFYNSIDAIRECKYKEALNFIEIARSSIDKKIKSLLTESYARGYELLFKNEIWYHWEEIINFKNGKISKEKLLVLWNRRLDILGQDPFNFERVLAVRSWIWDMNEDYESYFKWGKLCRKNNYLDCYEKVLKRMKNKLFLDHMSNEIKVRIELELNKCRFEKGGEKEAIENTKKIITEYNLQEISDKIKSKVYSSFAIFSINRRDIKKLHNENNWKIIMQYLELSTKYNTKNYKSWHSYALWNYKYYEYLLSSSESNKNIPLTNTALSYVMNAINGFKNSICIGGKNISKTLQDWLRLIDWWFTTGSNSDISMQIDQALNSIDIDSYLFITPQLLARIDVSDITIFTLLHKLLLKIGNAHPRAWVYPLIVMNNSRNKKRKVAALNILNEMRSEHKDLINECTMFIQEWNRCAMLLHEEWNDTIEEGAKLYFTDKDTNGMIKILLHAHEKINKQPETMNEVHFYQLYLSELKQAEAHIWTYMDTKNELELKEAWEIYHTIFKNLSVQFSTFKLIQLENVSPKLANFRQSKICVPGLYMNGKNLIRISHWGLELNIFSTKQHPRKLSIYGTDDKEYTFLWKGHEDLRQDERAMQLFSMINTLLENNRKTANKNLFITCFSVIPLSHNTGIIGWVPNCDTLHQLIKEYRTNNKIIQNAEHRLMYSYYSNFESATFLCKVELFKTALHNTWGWEIYKILWTKSKNSEAWLERRTNYSRSLAVMSMVGYILGWGDRHPSNLMLHRQSGKIIHIDFGDCFEVAMKRDKYPERVPFRLTRMLIKALELSSIEGTFRITCETVMSILRENKDSLLAILESFVHDPWISFRWMIPMIMKKNRLLKNIKNSKKEIPNTQNNNNNNNDNEDELQLGRITLRTTINNNNTTHNNITSNWNEATNQWQNTDQKELIEEYERKKMEHDERQIITWWEEKEEVESDDLNKIGKIVIERINDKLEGTDFDKNTVLDVEKQTDKWIRQATSHENLAQSYWGWCPYW